jgi:hypothetical protein
VAVLGGEEEHESGEEDGGRAPSGRRRDAAICGGEQ